MINISFTDKEISVIQLIEPNLTPEETCNKVLHDWFNANISTLPSQTKTPEQIVDDVIAVNEVQVNKLSTKKNVII